MIPLICSTGGGFHTIDINVEFSGEPEELSSAAVRTNVRVRQIFLNNFF